jgi:hypothetical protein
MLTRPKPQFLAKCGWKQECYYNWENKTPYCVPSRY